MVTSGFEGFEITWRQDVFSGAPQQSSAAAFGTLGITFRAYKPAIARTEAELPVSQTAASPVD